MSKIRWQEKSQETFDVVISNLPQFHRTIAERLVKESAEELAQKRGKDTVELADLIETFFNEVPPAFKEMMERLFRQLNIDYSEYLAQ